MSNLFKTYLDVAEWQNEYSILPKNTIDTTVEEDPSFALFITASLSASTGIANSYIQSRYIVPLQNPTFELKTYIAMIADFRIISRRGFMVGEKYNLYVNNYDMAVEYLTNVKNGSVSLDSSEILVSGSSTETVSQKPEIDTGTTYVYNPSTYGSRGRGW